MNALLESTAQVAACARLRDALTSRGILPEVAAPIARATVAGRSCFERFGTLMRNSPLGPWSCIAALRDAGLWSTGDRHAR